MEKSEKNIIYTLGHSNHSLETFVELLRRHEIEVVIDVRSQPYSKYCGYFNKEALAGALERVGIAYRYIGKVLGARPADRSVYEGEYVSFEKLAARPDFQAALQEVVEQAGRKRTVMLCSEKDPLHCHRMILLSRQLKGKEVEVGHILGDGALEAHRETERRLVKEMKIEPTLFEPDLTEEEMIERAYAKQAEGISHQQEEADEVHV